MDAQASSSTGSSDVSGGWSTATAIGCLAGVPTAAFLQIGFIKTLRQRNVAVAKSRFGVPGLGYAVVRDCAYWSATQKQVQTPKPSWWEELTMQFGVVAVPLVCDTSGAVAEKVSVSLQTGEGPRACPPAALLGRMTWIPVYNCVCWRSSGLGTPAVHEGLGPVGSLAAAHVAGPLFVFKDPLCHDGGGALDVRGPQPLRGGPQELQRVLFSGLRSAAAAVGPMKGANPPAIANIDPMFCAWARRRALLVGAQRRGFA